MPQPFHAYGWWREYHHPEKEKIWGSEWRGHWKKVKECKLWVKWSESHSVVSDSLWPQGLYSPWNSPGQNTGMGSLSLLQGNFPTQGPNPGLPHCRQILNQLSHKGSPGILGWLAYPCSRGSSLPRNQTRVSCIAGGFFVWMKRTLKKVKECKLWVR